MTDPLPPNIVYTTHGPVCRLCGRKGAETHTCDPPGTNPLPFRVESAGDYLYAYGRHEWER